MLGACFSERRLLYVFGNTPSLLVQTPFKTALTGGLRFLASRRKMDVIVCGHSDQWKREKEYGTLHCDHV